MAVTLITCPAADFSGFGIDPVRIPFTPVGLPSLLAWYDAQAAETIAQSGGAVSAWSDRANGWHMTQTSPGRRPTYLATGWDGTLPALTFDGLSDVGPLTQGDFLSNATGPYSTDQAVFIVAERAASQNAYAGSSARALWVSAAPAGANFSQVYVSATASPQETIAAAGGGTGSQSISKTGFVGKALAFSSHVGTGELRLSVNGAPLAGTGALGTIAGSGASIAGLAGSNDGQLSNRFAGKVAEIIVLNAVPDTTLRQKVEGYLAWKWGIAANLDITHPYRTERPAA